ncbi:hypothetical protein FBQ97_20860 [Acidobacteria bacterium ACD]|nr:hypothetical protein [Acidobacteria bacterium ACD]
MPIVVQERFESRSVEGGSNPSAELRYWISGSDVEADVTAALTAATATTYNGLVRQSVHVEPEGPELWGGTVRYGPAQFGGQPTGGSVFSFEIGGGTQKITQSRATVASYAPPSETAPDHKGAIGVTESGVEGVDVVTPVYQFSETHYKSNADVDEAYRLAVLGLSAAPVNSAPFRGHDVGEVLFLGASGSKRTAPDGSEDWEITFRFAVSKNATGLVVGDIVGIDKKGWEYLWVQYREFADDEAGSLVRRPVAAYVERVYDSSDFAVLEL